MNNDSLPKYGFNWMGILLLVAGGILPVMILGVANVLSMFKLHKNYMYADWFLVISNTLMWIGAILAFDYLACRPQTRKPLNFSLSPKNLGTYLLIFPMMLGMIFIAEFITNQIPIKGPFFGPMYDIFSEMMEQMTSDTATMVLLAVFMAPLFEEIVFRGIIQKGLINKGWNPQVAIWTSALFFGLVHGNPWQFVGAVLLGFVMGTVYHRTKSLLLPILLHAFNNLLSTLLVKFYGIESFSQAFGISEYTVLAIGVLLFGVFYYLFTQKYNVHHAEN